MSGPILDLNNPIDQGCLEKLRVAAGDGPVLILTHDSPDPDALAAGVALAVLLDEAWGIPSRLVYSGMVARAENRAVLSFLTPQWQQDDNPLSLYPYSAIALVDTQPGSGNNRLPPDVQPQIVIDHHYRKQAALPSVRYVDIRPELGATSSLLYLYLQAAGIEPDAELATALFYGLQTDTRGLARDASHVDEVIYLRLLGNVDRTRLAKVEQAGLSRDYFRAIDRGLQAAQVYGRVVVSYLGEMHRPDLAAEMADVLIRLESAKAALCLGMYQDQLHLSLRTDSSEREAGQIVQKVIGELGKAGGHGRMAGGQVTLTNQDKKAYVDEVKHRFLEVMGEKGPGVPLLANGT